LVGSVDCANAVVERVARSVAAKSEVEVFIGLGVLS
jgi:hypothetical protein